MKSAPLNTAETDASLAGDQSSGDVESGSLRRDAHLVNLFEPAGGYITVPVTGGHTPDL